MEPVDGNASRRANRRVEPRRGRAAKRFVDQLFAHGGGVIFCATKPDKYDRYLADVFIAAAEDDEAEGEGVVFLNQALLDAGYADVKREWSPADWEA